MIEDPLASEDSRLYRQIERPPLIDRLWHYLGGLRSRRRRMRQPALSPK